MQTQQSTYVSNQINEVVKIVEQTFVSLHSICMLSLRYKKYISYFIKNTCSANTLYMNHIETGSKKTKGKKTSTHVYM